MNSFLIHYQIKNNHLQRVMYNKLLFYYNYWIIFNYNRGNVYAKSHPKNSRPIKPQLFKKTSHDNHIIKFFHTKNSDHPPTPTFKPIKTPSAKIPNKGHPNPYIPSPPHTHGILGIDLNSPLSKAAKTGPIFQNDARLWGWPSRMSICYDRLFTYARNISLPAFSVSFFSAWKMTGMINGSWRVCVSICRLRAEARIQ